MHPRRLGPFLLVSRLAAGGMGEVFRAHQVEPPTRMPLCVKCMLPAYNQDSEMRQLFTDEIELTKRMRHANVVSVHQGGEIDGQLYYAMEFIDGMSLRDLLARLVAVTRPLPLPVFQHIARGVLNALEYVHALKDGDQPLEVVMRDISPDNVMVSRRGEIKVLDFGIARSALGARFTRPGQMRGKVRYASPEMIEGTALGPRSDLYAAAATLWELLAGRPMIEADSEPAMMQSIVKGRHTAIGSVRPDVPAAIDAALERALSPDPGRRFDSAKVFLAALHKCGVPADVHATAALVVEMTQVKASTENDPTLNELEQASGWKLARNVAEGELAAEAAILVPLVLERARAQKHRVPPLPAVAHEILTVLQQSDLDIKRLIATLQKDPVVSAELMRVANSPLFRAARPLETLREAVVRLGVDESAAIAMAVASRSLFGDSAAAAQLRPHLWHELQRDSLTVAYGAAWLSKAVKRGDPARVFLAGMFHRIGRASALSALLQLALAKQLPFSLGDEVTRMVSDSTAVDLGTELLLHWNLPTFVVECCAAVDNDYVEPDLVETHLVRIVSGLHASSSRRTTPEGLIERVLQSIEVVGVPRADLSRLQAEIISLADKVDAIIAAPAGA